MRKAGCARGRRGAESAGTICGRIEIELAGLKVATSIGPLGEAGSLSHSVRPPVFGLDMFRLAFVAAFLAIIGLQQLFSQTVRVMSGQTYFFKYNFLPWLFIGIMSLKMVVASVTIYLKFAVKLGRNKYFER
jgi:hypothetical protein